MATEALLDKRGKPVPLIVNSTEKPPEGETYDWIPIHHREKTSEIVGWRRVGTEPPEPFEGERMTLMDPKGRKVVVAGGSQERLPIKED